MSVWGWLGLAYPKFVGLTICLRRLYITTLFGHVGFIWGVPYHTSLFKTELKSSDFARYGRTLCL